MDEAAEERKGGAGDLGKFLLSAGETQLVGLAHVPKALAEAKGLTLKVGAPPQFLHDHPLPLLNAAAELKTWGLSG